MANNNEGITRALGDAQVRRLLEAPAPDTLKGIRDRAILATLLLSRHPPRRALPASPARYAELPGRDAFPYQGQARQNPVRTGASDGAKAD
jgi:hypothetical protein